MITYPAMKTHKFKSNYLMTRSLRTTAIITATAITRNNTKTGVTDLEELFSLVLPFSSVPAGLIACNAELSSLPPSGILVPPVGLKTWLSEDSAVFSTLSSGCTTILTVPVFGLDESAILTMPPLPAPPAVAREVTSFFSIVELEPHTFFRERTYLDAWINVNDTVPSEETVLLLRYCNNASFSL